MVESCHLFLEPHWCSCIYEVAPEETEDDGAEQEVEKSYFQLLNPEGEAEAEGPRRSIV